MTQRMGLQLNRVFLSKYTELGNSCSATRKESDCKEVMAEGVCAGGPPQKQQSLPS